MNEYIVRVGWHRKRGRYLARSITGWYYYASKQAHAHVFDASDDAYQAARSLRWHEPVFRVLPFVRRW